MNIVNKAKTPEMASYKWIIKESSSTADCFPSMEIVEGKKKNLAIFGWKFVNLKGPWYSDLQSFT